MPRIGLALLCSFVSLAWLTHATALANGLLASPFVSFDVGSEPQAVATSDFDGDGNLDLAVVNYGSSSVSILRGDGNGSFGTATSHPLGVFPRGLAIADLDGDDDPDLVASNFASNTISVHTGIAGAAFGARTDHATAAGPWGVAIAELSGDSTPDLVVTCETANRISVFLGTGGGAYGPRVDYLTGTAPRGVAVADLNSDTRADLVVANWGSGTVSVLLGNGGGAFGFKTDYSADEGARAVAIGNVTGGAPVDLVVANESQPRVSVLPGNGNGTFGERVDLAVASGPSSVVLEDWNSDGLLDVGVALGREAGQVVTFLQAGGGTLDGPHATPTGQQPRGLAAGDFDEDGLVDAATANEASTSVSVLLGNGNGTFGTHRTAGAAPIPTGLAVGSLTGDSNLDLAVLQNMSQVSILRGVGNADFVPAGTYPMGSGSTPLDVTVGDVNGDLRSDLLIAYRAFFEGGGVSAFLGNPDGTFTLPTDFPTDRRARSVTTADLNTDGRLDIVLGNDDTSDLTVLLGDPVTLFGSPTHFATRHDSWQVVAAHLNGDAALDLAAVSGDFASLGPFTHVSVLIGNGNGTFQPRVDYLTGPQPESIAAGDFNSDGRTDLVTANSFGGQRSPATVSVLLGLAGGGFAPKVDYPVGPYPRSVACGDLNGDSSLDIAVANHFGNTVSVLLGNGDGTFAPRTDYGTGGGPLEVVIADLDGDADLDLATVNFASEDVTILLGTGGPVVGDVIASCPADGEWIAGEVHPLDFRVDGTFPTTETVTWRIESERAWPGFPLLGSVEVPAGGGVDFGVGVPVPDSAAFGANPLRLIVRSKASPAIADTCAFVLADPDWDVAPVVVPPGDHVWQPGEPDSIPFGIRNRDSSPHTLILTLSSLRSWPGFPVQEGVNLAPGESLAVYLPFVVPDSVAAGANVLTLVARWQDRAAVHGSADLHIHDVATPTRLALIEQEAEAGAGFVRLAWWTAERGAATARIERRMAGDGWEARGDVTPDAGGRIEFVDRAVIPGERYAWRAGLSTQDGFEWSTETWIDVPTALAGVLAFAEARASVITGSLDVAFVIPVVGPVRLEAFDVSGRRVAAGSLGDARPGTHAIRLAEAGALRPGMYFLRLTQGGARVTSRVLVVGTGR